MQLLPDPSLKLSSGDFNAKVDGEDLKLPLHLFRILAARNIHTAEQLVAMCQSVELSLAMMLDWRIDATQMAIQKLYKILEGHISANILHPGPIVDFPVDEIN